MSCVDTAVPSGPGSPTKGPNSSLSRDSRYKLTSVSLMGLLSSAIRLDDERHKGIRQQTLKPLARVTCFRLRFCDAPTVKERCRLGEQALHTWVTGSSRSSSVCIGSPTYA